MDEVLRYEVGTSYSIEYLKVGNVIDVVGNLKGCGFIGVMKCYNFKGFNMGYGTYEVFWNVGMGG